MISVTIRIEKDGNEFHAWCPELQGCHTHGKTIDSATKHLKEAIGLYLDDLVEDLVEESKVKAKQEYLVA